MNENNVFISIYPIGKTVYLKTDLENKPRIVTAIFFFDGGHSYTLACGSESTSHYEFEISEHKTFE